MEIEVVAERLRTAGCVFAEDEASLLLAESGDDEVLAERLQRRLAGEPLEVILGWAEFCGLRIAVASGVFVPRRRTGVLVDEAMRLLVEEHRHRLPGPTPPPAVVDLCCGSGAVSRAIAHRAETLGLTVSVHAADIDPSAVACARGNLAGIAAVHLGDLDEPLPAVLRGAVSILVANAPHVPTDEIIHMPSEARDHEPTASLDGGADGLAVQRRLIGRASIWLRPGGHLLVETSRELVDRTAVLMTAAGLAPRVVRRADIDGTAIVGQWPAATA